MHKHFVAFVFIKAQDELYCKYMLPGAGTLSEVCKKVVLAQRILSYKNIMHVSPGKELIYILSDR